MDETAKRGPCGQSNAPLTVKNVITDRRIAEVRRIYISSFPAKERMPFPMMVLMSLLWHTRLLSFYDGDTLCGMLYTASMGRMTFVMFFAVDANLRSRGYGSRILEELRRMYPKNKLVLSIEPCDETAQNYEERLKRKRFYLSNGYRESGYMTRISGQTQEILIQNGNFDPRQYRLFFMLYSNLTMYPKVWLVEDKAAGDR